MKRDELPPGVYRTDQHPDSRLRGDQTAPAGEGEPPLKPDFKDFVALTIAVYQILLGPLLLLVGALVAVYLLFSLVAR